MKNKNKETDFHLVIDANAIFRKWLIADGMWEQAAERAQIHLPLVVYKEHQNNYRKEIQEKIYDNIEKVRKGDANFLNVAPPIDEACKSFKDRLDKRLAKLEIDLIPLPDVPHEVILERSLEHKPPLNRKDKDGSGYRDTLIWLSLLEFVRKEKPDELFFYCKDKDDFWNDEKNDLMPELRDEFESETSGETNLRIYDTLKAIIDELPGASDQTISQDIEDRLSEDTDLRLKLEQDLANTVEGKSLLIRDVPFRVSGLDENVTFQNIDVTSGFGNEGGNQHLIGSGTASGDLSIVSESTGVRSEIPLQLDFSFRTSQENDYPDFHLDGIESINLNLSSVSLPPPIPSTHLGDDATRPTDILQYGVSFSNQPGTIQPSTGSLNDSYE